MFAMQQKGQLKRDHNTVAFYLEVHVRGLKKSISAVWGTGWSVATKASIAAKAGGLAPSCLRKLIKARIGLV